MTQKTKVRAVLAIALAAVLGFAAGWILFYGQGLSGADAPATPGIASFDDARNYFITSATPVMASSFIVFLSGFTLFPLVISLPVITYRALALGCAISASLSTANHIILIALISYAAATLFIASLAYCAVAFSKSPQRSSARETGSFAYTFLSVSGASILIKIIPCAIAQSIR